MREAFMRRDLDNLTSYFNQWNNKNKFYVQFEILSIMSTPSLQKELHVQQFLEQFNLSNKKQTEIKRLIIESIQELVDKRIIKQLFKIIQKDGSLIVQNNLTSKLITKTKVIYLEKIIDYKYLLNQLKSQFNILQNTFQKVTELNLGSQMERRT